MNDKKTSELNDMIAEIHGCCIELNQQSYNDERESKRVNMIDDLNKALITLTNIRDNRSDFPAGGISKLIVNNNLTKIIEQTIYTDQQNIAVELMNAIEELTFDREIETVLVAATHNDTVLAYVGSFVFDYINSKLSTDYNDVVALRNIVMALKEISTKMNIEFNGISDIISSLDFSDLEDYFKCVFSDVNHTERCTKNIEKDIAIKNDINRSMNIVENVDGVLATPTPGKSEIVRSLELIDAIELDQEVHITNNESELTGKQLIRNVINTIDCIDKNEVAPPVVLASRTEEDQKIRDIIIQNLDLALQGKTHSMPIIEYIISQVRNNETRYNPSDVVKMIRATSVMNDHNYINSEIEEYNYIRKSIETHFFSAKEDAINDLIAASNIGDYEIRSNTENCLELVRSIRGVHFKSKVKHDFANKFYHTKYDKSKVYYNKISPNTYKRVPMNEIKLYECDLYSFDVTLPDTFTVIEYTCGKYVAVQCYG